MCSNKARIVLLGALLCMAFAAFGQELVLGSYNIRYRNDGDESKGHLWKKRCQVICDQIHYELPDAFGAQEVLKEQLDDLLRGLPEYDYVGVGRDDGREAGEFAPIFYQRERLVLLSDGYFWLSPNRTKPSLGWDAACIRICTWAKFKVRKTGKVFLFFNLHTDHVGVKARYESAKLVMRAIDELGGSDSPVVLTGDFNVDQTDETYAIFTADGRLKDAYTVAKYRFAENGTFNSFNPSLKTTSRIDHIFVSPSFTVTRYGVLPNFYWTEEEYTKSEKGHDAPQQINFKPHRIRTASDHYPVFVKVKLKP